MTTEEAQRTFQAGTPWPEIAKAQIQELQTVNDGLKQTIAAQTSLFNQMLDRIDHMELTIHRYINGDNS